MELWDLYDENRKSLEEVVIRGTRIPKGKYHIVVECMILDKDNNVLITKRAPGKHHPFTWECTTGSIVSGEDSTSGILREIYEETGLVFDKEQLHLIRTERTDRTIRDTYLACIPHIDLSKIRLQAEETIAAKTCTLQQFQDSDFDENDSNAAFLIAQYSRFQSLMGIIMRVRDQVFGREAEKPKATKPVNTTRTTLGSKTAKQNTSNLPKQKESIKKGSLVSVHGPGTSSVKEEVDRDH